MNPLYIAAAIFAGLFLFKGKKATTNTTNGTGNSKPPQPVTPADLDGQLRLGLQGVIAAYGADVARNVERIFRLETGNFTSGLFKLTNAAGMKAFAQGFPFGWKARGTTAADYAPLVSMAENAGGPVEQWVSFKQLPTALLYLGSFLKEYGNNAGRWNSTDPAIQAAYMAKLNNFGSAIVDDMTGKK